MPRAPRTPLPERQCVQCGEPYRPVSSPQGGQPAKRCKRCRQAHVLPLRATSEDATTAVADLLAEGMRASLVSWGVRSRLLDVALLLAAHADATGSTEVQACAAELRTICGLNAATANTVSAAAPGSAVSQLRAGSNQHRKRPSR
jgi:hypothetical protein